MTPDGSISVDTVVTIIGGFIGAALIAMLAWLALLLISLQRRLDALDSATKAMAAQVEEKRPDGHWITNWIPATEGVLQDHENRIAKIEGRPPEDFEFPKREVYHAMFRRQQ